MTFDFTPDWLDAMSTAADYANPAPHANFTPAAPLRALAAAGAPPSPTMDQVAALVGELFAEGSLSFEQLCSLSAVPELESLLDDTLAGVAPIRRTGAARR